MLNLYRVRPGRPHTPRIREIPDTTPGRFRLAGRRDDHDDQGMNDKQPPGEAPEDPPRPADARATPPDRSATSRGHRADARSSTDRLARASLVAGRGATTAAVVVAVTAAAGGLALLGGLLTLAGWGLAVVVALVAVTVAAALRPRPANGWLLVPLLALALPSVAVAVSGVRVIPQRGAVIETPTVADQIPDDGYRAGLGDLLVDLRELRAAPGDEVVVRAGSDLGRTVVALPQDQCFALDVRWKTGGLRLPGVRERPTVLGIRSDRSLKQLGLQGPRLRRRYGVDRGRITLFGRASDEDRGRWVAPNARSDAPTLVLELESEGGSFVVRDYPNDVAPLLSPEWPLDLVPPPYARTVSYPGLRATLAAQQRAVERVVRRRAPGTTTASDSVPRAAERPRRTTQVTAPAAPATAPTVSLDRQGNLAPASEREVRSWHESAKRRQAFARKWARQVIGACKPQGTFR